MQILTVTPLNTIRRPLEVTKRIWSKRIFANTPVLLVALSVSMAAAYGTQPQQAPDSPSAAHGQQQLTTTQAQPTSSNVEVSEPAWVSEADQAPASDPNIRSETPVSQEKISSTSHTLYSNTTDFELRGPAEPPDTCTSGCTALSDPRQPPTSCGLCQPELPMTELRYSCATQSCTD